VGRCGREYCCSSWLTELSPVSLSLAKDQSLSLNPSQISGGCGRLLCCLKYEHEFYVSARKRFPRAGKSLRTARGTERVVAVDIFRERVLLRHDEQGQRIVSLSDLKLEAETVALEAPPASRTPPAESITPAVPVAEPPTESVAEPAPADSASASARRRRRRRRRGRGGSGGQGGPPGAPEP
jgi:hypothetical protein